MTFGEKLQALRKSRGWSQEQLAERIAVSRQAVSKWESGAAVADTENVVELSRLFGVSTDYLLHDDYDGDCDIPAVKSREAALKKQKNREMAMMVLIGVEALAFFWQLMGFLVYNSVLIPLLGMTVHIVTIIGFEAGFRGQLRYELQAQPEAEALDCRRVFYRVSVWLVSLFPIACLTRIFWFFYPRPYSNVFSYLLPLVLYAVLGSFVTWKLRKKK